MVYWIIFPQYQIFIAKINEKPYLLIIDNIYGYKFYAGLALGWAACTTIKKLKSMTTKG